MTSVDDRKKEQQARRRFNRNRRKRSLQQVVETIDIDDIEVVVPISSQYAPLFTLAEDTKLLDLALKYDLPLTNEQLFLVETGDTLLPQFKKLELPEEQQIDAAKKGFVLLSSSNIAAVAIDVDDLLLLFHSGDTYRYPNQADMYFPFNEALSPGRLLHRTIRFARGYSKEA